VTSARALVDLSHRIADGVVTYPGLPAPRIRVHTSRAASLETLGTGASFEIAAIDMVANTGTYIDTPSHYYLDGPDLGEVPLAALADLPGIAIRCSPTGPITRERLEGYDVAGRAVLLDTGWSARFGTAAYAEPGAPFVAGEAIELLIERGAALVGIDSINIDDRADLARPAHAGLLRAGIPIVEHLANLGSLPESGFRFTAAPPMVSGMATFPVRAFAIVPAGA
jgi:arylformamidase